VEDFVLTSSKVNYLCRKSQVDIQQLDQSVPICSSPLTIAAAYELLSALATGCLPNLKYLVDTVTSLFYSG